MCTRNQLLGWAMVSLGVGILIGLRLQDHFGGNLIGIGISLAGILRMSKKF